MNGGQATGDSQRGSTKRWGHGRLQCATNCGNRPTLEQWAAVLWTPSIQLAHLECTGPHALGTQFLRHIIEDSPRVWYAHARAPTTPLKACLGPGSTIALVLQELRLHQQAEREGVQREVHE